MSEYEIKQVKHCDISNLTLTSADTLPPADAATLRSAGGSPLELAVPCVIWKVIKVEEEK